MTIRIKQIYITDRKRVKRTYKIRIYVYIYIYYIYVY